MNIKELSLDTAGTMLIIFSTVMTGYVAVQLATKILGPIEVKIKQ